MRKGYGVVLGLLGTAVLAGGGAVFALSMLQERLAFHPSKVVDLTPQAVGLSYEDVRLDTPDGESIAGWWISAPHPDATILFLHGNAGNISHRLHDLVLLEDAGLSTLIIDYRGYGESSGTPSEAGLYTDARTAWEYLVRDRGIDPARLVVYGESIGSAPALHLVRGLARSHRPGPGAVVLEGAFTSALDMGKRAFPFLPMKLILKLKMNNLEAIREIRAPTLFLHAAEDEIVPVKMGRRLYDASGATLKEIHEVPGAMHNTVWMIGGDQVQEVVRDFIDKALGPA